MPRSVCWIGLRNLLFSAWTWLIVFGMPTVGTAAEWPQFRGANGNGAAESDFPQTWDRATNVLWKVAVPGEGWSGPIVWGDRVFVTAAVRADGDGATRPERAQGGGRRADLVNANYHWDVLCFQLATGELLWRKTAHAGQPPQPRHTSNTYATETPVTDGERVYAYFGMVGVYCYDMNGEPIWQKELGNYPMQAGWGTSSSPTLFGGKLFVQVDNERESFLVALDGRTGKELWRVAREESSQYSTPIIWQNSQRAELIAGGKIYRSYDPETGRLLWQLNMQKGRSSATALASGDRLYVGTEERNRGGEDDGGGYLFAIKPGGSGDISPPGDATQSEFVEWKISRSGLQMASPVLCAGHLYLLDRRSGILHCVHAETGQTAYRTRIPNSRAFWSSPWTQGDRVYCLDDDGNTHILAGGPELHVLAVNALQEHTWSSPAIAQGALLLRTVEHLYCISANVPPKNH
jgi:outer membrane protein assembly factor BamB